MVGAFHEVIGSQVDLRGLPRPVKFQRVRNQIVECLRDPGLVDTVRRKVGGDLDVCARAPDGLIELSQSRSDQILTADHLIGHLHALCPRQHEQILHESIHPLCGSNHAVEVIDALHIQAVAVSFAHQVREVRDGSQGLSQIVRADVQEGFQIAIALPELGRALLHAVLQFFMGPSQCLRRLLTIRDVARDRVEDPVRMRRRFPRQQPPGAILVLIAVLKLQDRFTPADLAFHFQKCTGSIIGMHEVEEGTAHQFLEAPA